MGDASHRSHKVVAPMAKTLFCSLTVYKDPLLAESKGGLSPQPPDARRLWSWLLFCVHDLTTACCNHESTFASLTWMNGYSTTGLHQHAAMQLPSPTLNCSSCVLHLHPPPHNCLEWFTRRSQRSVGTTSISAPTEGTSFSNASLVDNMAPLYHRYNILRIYSAV